jgi:hypothetical protein
MHLYGLPKNYILLYLFSNSHPPCSHFSIGTFTMNYFLLSFFILSFLTSHVRSQQNYSGNSVQNCLNTDENGPSPAFLYTYNGHDQSCQSFLIYMSQPPYNSVTTISNLTSSEPIELSRINNVTRQATFPANKEVIVPVNCSSVGQYYQFNTTYILNTHDTYFTVASNTYQGLSTCNSLIRENSYNQLQLISGMVLLVPLRCACPTSNQTESGTKYLLTYLVNWDDTIPDIARRFKVSTESILEANGFSEENPNLFPSTTILIPLPTEPSSSDTIIHHQKPVMSGSSSSNSKKSITEVYIALAISIFLVLSVILAAVFLFHKKIFGRFWQRDGKETPMERESIARLRVEIADFGQALKVFEFIDIEKATGNFSNENRIMGSVYRRVFGRKILAVKNMSREATEEVKMLKKINHFNLINLEGVCEKHGSYSLVFEYMENGMAKWKHVHR